MMLFLTVSRVSSYSKKPSIWDLVVLCTYLTTREVTSLLQRPHLLLTSVLLSTVTLFNAKRAIALSEQFWIELPHWRQGWTLESLLMMLFLTVSRVSSYSKKPSIWDLVVLCTYLTTREVTSLLQRPHLLLTSVLLSTVTLFNAKRAIALSEQFWIELPHWRQGWTLESIPPSVVLLLMLFLKYKWGE